MKDYNAYIYKYFRIIWLKSSCFFYSIFNEVQAKIFGIDLGRNNRFWGGVNFSRYPNSIIKTGVNCRFRSTSYSNLIGINHKCILSTHTNSAKIIIGDNCGFSGVTIGCANEIIIGDNVKCGANVVITDTDWHSEDIRSGKPQPIHIEDNVWLGLNAIVLKGVHIGKNSIIGANSVITIDIPPNSVAVGNPCRIVKNVD